MPSLIVIAGFLGSGKTSLLSAWLELVQDQGLKTVILENEAGKIGLDDRFLAGQGIEVRGLMGGCACCDLQPRLIEEIQKIWQANEHDLVFLEASGVASPDQLLAGLRRYGPPDLAYKSVVLIDASRFSKLFKALKPLLSSQLATAHLVVISKVDIAEAGEIRAAEESARQLAPAAQRWQVDLTSPQAPQVAALLHQEAFAGRLPLESPLSAPGRYQTASFGLHLAEEGLAPDDARRLVRELVSNLLDSKALGHIKLLGQDARGREVLISGTTPKDVSRRGEGKGPMMGSATLNIVTMNSEAELNSKTLGGLLEGYAQEIRLLSS